MSGNPANIPHFDTLKKSDYGKDGLGSQDALDKFFTQQNGQNAAVKGAISGLSWANLNAQPVEFTVTTPATDWVTFPLATGWTSTLAVSQGFPAMRYRYVPGGIYIDGGCEFTTGTTALPSTIANTPTGANLDFQATLTPWVQVTAPAVWAGMGLVRVTPAGLITLRAGAVPAPAGPWTVQAILFDNYLPLPTLGAPPLSCFPVNVKIQDGKTPAGMFLTAVIDQGANPPSISPGIPAWSAVQSQTGFPNAIKVTNIAGLALGRTYTIRGVVLFK